ncbi:VanZ family protein [Polaromonas jejuensis]|uniref:VanZ family protein n=1 Tax=Polaromonas jejuensis TaxID=457502 RepID=A0ABW0Q8H9_9BURK|nr:VanZ family protein [Polaromonas jejuensis]
MVLPASPSARASGAHRTIAWPLALAYICLIIYASLYPFTDWRNQGIFPLKYLTAPWPKYWTWFDIGINLVGYAPLGFLLVLSALRTRRVRWAVTVAALSAALLSLLMETLQGYQLSRVASNVDVVFNALGAWLGACCAWGLEKAGVVDRWSRLRAYWFAPDARGALVLLLLWPPALLFPAAVPMGLGQVFERLESALADALADTPFLEWLPVREVELQPLVPMAELMCVTLGALIPCLLGYCVIRTLGQRAAFSAVVIAVGIATSALSAALSYGPQHAWAWLDVPVQVGLGLTAVLALALLAVPRRGAAALTLLALAIHLGLLNQAPASAYFAQTLQTWEQGRFIHFYGLAQWLGWLWPYAALLYMLVRLSGRERGPVAEK